MTDSPRDTGDLLEVPEDRQLDVDPDPEGEADHAALVDGVLVDDDSDLADVYANPGEIVDATELQ